MNLDLSRIKYTECGLLHYMQQGAHCSGFKQFGGRDLKCVLVYLSIFCAGPLLTSFKLFTLSCNSQVYVCLNTYFAPISTMAA